MMSRPTPGVKSALIGQKAGGARAVSPLQPPVPVGGRLSGATLAAPRLVLLRPL